MYQEHIVDKGVGIGGGAYFASLEELSSPRHQAIQDLMSSIRDRSLLKFKKAVKDATVQGWDINQIVFQDSPNSWYHLGTFLASRASAQLGALFSAYIEMDGVDLSAQEALTHDKHFKRVIRAHKNKDPEAFSAVHETTRMPIAHVFLRQWASYLPAPSRPKDNTNTYLQGKYKAAVKLHAAATEIFEKMNNHGVNWAALDQRGNTLCHVLVERESSETLRFLLPWLRTLGVSMSSENEQGLTPSASALHRIARAKASQTNTINELTTFRETISSLERDLLNDHTALAKSVARPRF